MQNEEKLAILEDYASGNVGTRLAIERLGIEDYADLVIALLQNDLALPKPKETQVLQAHRERARDILLSRLKHGS